MIRVASALFLVCALAQGQNNGVDQAWNLAAAGDRAGAESVLRILLRSDPGNVDGHLLLGSLLVEDEQRDPAI